MIATLFHQERTSAANHRRAQYTSTRIRRPGKQEWQQDIQMFVKDIKYLILEVLCSHCVVKHKINKRETFVKLSGDVPRAFKRFPPYLSSRVRISSQAPTTFECPPQIMTELRPGMVLTSRRTHTSVRRMGRSALKNQYPWWRLIFFRFLSFKQRLICTGTVSFF